MRSILDALWDMIQPVPLFAASVLFGLFRQSPLWPALGVVVALVYMVASTGSSAAYWAAPFVALNLLGPPRRAAPGPPGHRRRRQRRPGGVTL